MSSSTIKTVPTLKGMFNEPKMNHRRNFLLENKLSLREKNIKITKEEEEKCKLEKQQKHHQKMQTIYQSKRSSSQDSNYTDSRNGLDRHMSDGSLRCDKFMSECPQQQLMPSQRSKKSLSQKCNNDSVSQCGSNLSVKSSADKLTQTDDIQDEEYLYNALKKCTSYETKTIMNNRNNFQEKSCSDMNLPMSSRSTANPLQDYYHGDDKNVDALSVGRQSMHSTLHDAHNNEPPISGRSNKSIASNRHKLGSRENLRLPAYMEREQREKAAEIRRVLDIDPECPPGHFALSAAERQSALQFAQSKFDTLINELNRMPVTSDTMRTRSRRNEIEKELLEIEKDLRMFGKSKVFVKYVDATDDYQQ